jgi:hypothetical protein
MKRERKIDYSSTPNGYSEACGQWGVAKIVVQGTTQAKIHFQDGPAAECGHNGVQCEEVIQILIDRYRMLNTHRPCRDNSIVITKLQEALFWDRARTEDREARGVEGTNES